jgi:hypothetical protein
VSEIPQRATGKYLGLYQDICLRLEQTSPTEALRYPMDDPKALAGAQMALKKMFKDQQVRVIRAEGALFVYKAVEIKHRGVDRPPRNGHHNGRRLEGVPTAVEMFEPALEDTE